jgi:hypothetical protein
MATRKTRRVESAKERDTRALIEMFRHLLPDIARINNVAAYSVSVAILALEEEISIESNAT